MQTHNLIILRGSGDFTRACALAASVMAASAPIQAAQNQVEASAHARVMRQIGPQDAQALPTSKEQEALLKYATFPPVKTTILGSAGRKETHWTLHPFDVVRLVREASLRAKSIEGITVEPAKIGAVLLAESSFVARTGFSVNGKTPSLGIAQMEPATARALKIDPIDPLQAATGAARLLAEGKRFAQQNRGVNQDLAISLAYNVSSKLRNQLVSTFGSRLAVSDLPPATQHHVKNMAYGEQKMKIFAGLYDQHLKHQGQTQINTPPRKEFVMSPQPSTKSLVAGLPSAARDMARRAAAQIHLENAGHRVSPTPMTQAGLDSMRRQINTMVQRVGHTLPAARLDDLARLGRGEPIATRVAHGSIIGAVPGFHSAASRANRATHDTVHPGLSVLTQERISRADHAAPAPRH